MSTSNTVLAQSATQLAVSTPAEISLEYLVEKNAKRTAKGVTRERQMLNRSKLFSACAAEYKSLRNIEASGRLDNETAKALDEAIDKFIDKQLGRINSQNALSFRRYLHHDVRNRRVTERLQNTGENMIALREQSLGIQLIIGQLNKRLDDLMKKPTPDYDREAAVKESIREAGFTQQFINARIADLEKEQQQKKSESN